MWKSLLAAPKYCTPENEARHCTASRLPLPCTTSGSAQCCLLICCWLLPSLTCKPSHAESCDCKIRVGSQRIWYCSSPLEPLEPMDLAAKEVDGKQAQTWAATDKGTNPSCIGEAPGVAPVRHSNAQAPLKSAAMTSPVLTRGSLVYCQIEAECRTQIRRQTDSSLGHV